MGMSKSLQEGQTRAFRDIALEAGRFEKTSSSLHITMRGHAFDQRGADLRIRTQQIDIDRFRRSHLKRHQHYRQ
jgi:hypothetical protein